jgi:hypothetical protein
MKKPAGTPDVDDLVKTLSVVLLAEYAAVMGAVALGHHVAALPETPPLGATVASLMPVGLFLAVLGTNVASMFLAVLFRKDADIAPFARLSLAFTAGQTILLAVSVAFGSPDFALVACGLTAAALAGTLLWSPGKMLRPPPPP